MSYLPLTRVVHEQLRRLIGPGDLAIDATAGNGRDTLFLAECVGPAGQVIAFDIQQAALDATRARIEAAGLTGRCRLVLDGHERMDAHVPAGWAGRVAAVMFNLGYLPGADKAVVTRPDTTLAALMQALPLLRAGGVLSVLVYRGHAGGRDEDAALNTWLERLPVGYDGRTRASAGPVWHSVLCSGSDDLHRQGD